MNTDLETILEDTPYNSYEDLFTAIYSNKAKIFISSRALRDISYLERPFTVSYGNYFGIIPSIVLTVIATIVHQNLFLLLLILLELIFPFIIIFLNAFKIKSTWLAIALIIIDLFFFELPIAIPLLAACWVINAWLLKRVENSLYRTSVRLLRNDVDSFVDAYYSSELTIEDCYGNRYSHSK